MDERSKPVTDDERSRIRFWLSQYTEQLESLLNRYPDEKIEAWHDSVCLALGYMRSAVESIPHMPAGRCACVRPSRGTTSFHCGTCGKVHR